MTVHVTWWWAAWAGGIIYCLGVLAGWAMLRMLWRIVMFILVIDR